MGDRMLVISTGICLAVAVTLDWWIGNPWSIDTLYIVPVALVCQWRHQSRRMLRAWCGAVVTTALIALVLGTLVQPAPLPNEALISAMFTGAILLFLGSQRIRALSADLSQTPSSFEKSALVSVMRYGQLFVAVKDRAGRHRLVSQHLLDSWGATAEIFIGHTDEEVAMDKEFGRRRHEEDLDYMALGQMVQLEEQFPRMPGRRFLSSRIPMKNNEGQVVGLVAISVEITDVVNAHTLNERHKITLAKSHKEFERFAYAAAHDLQEPLRTVASFCEILRDELPALDDEAAEYVSVIQDNATRGHQIVKDLLRYTQLQPGLQIEVIDLNELIQEITESILLRYPDATVTFGELPIVEGDRGMLRQVFTHLIGNGIKFNTNPRPHVDLTETLGDSGWKILVRDNGIGIEPAMQKRVFELFARLNDRDEFSGTGIGLAICRRAMELHDGNIEVVQSNSEGTSFVVQLPKKMTNPPFAELASSKFI